MTGQIEAIEGLLLSHLQSSNVPWTSFLIPFLHFSSNSQSRMNPRENDHWRAFKIIRTYTCTVHRTYVHAVNLGQPHNDDMTNLNNNPNINPIQLTPKHLCLHRRLTIAGRIQILLTVYMHTYTSHNLQEVTKTHSLLYLMPKKTQQSWPAKTLNQAHCNKRPTLFTLFLFLK